MRTENETKFFRLLGIARKAGKADYGIEKIRELIRRGNVKLALLSNDCSANTEKRLTNCCKFYEVPLIKTDISSEKLGCAIGIGETAAGIAICDEGFANAINDLQTERPDEIRS